MSGINDYMVQFGQNQWRLVRADTPEDAMQMVACFFRQPVFRALEAISPDLAVNILMKYKADFEQLVLCASPPSKEYRQKAAEWLKAQGKPFEGRGPAILRVNCIDEVARFG